MRTLGDLLRHTRAARGISQLELALRMGGSARHVSFVESNRARPSREFIVSWMRELEAPLSERNAALLLAGYTPALDSGGHAGAQLPSARAALSQMLEGHDPLPGYVFDSDWRTVEINRGAQWLCSVLMPKVWATLADRRGANMDLIGIASHPDGMLSTLRDPLVAGAALLAQLRVEQWLRPALRERADAFERSLVERFGAEPSDRDPGPASLNLVFDTQFGQLSFVTIESVFALPQDVTLASMRIELWFPADDSTRAVLAQHAPARDDDVPSDSDLELATP